MGKKDAKKTDISTPLPGSPPAVATHAVATPAGATLAVATPAAIARSSSVEGEDDIGTILRQLLRDNQEMKLRMDRDNQQRDRDNQEMKLRMKKQEGNYGN